MTKSHPEKTAEGEKTQKLKPHAVDTLPSDEGQKTDKPGEHAKTREAGPHTVDRFPSDQGQKTDKLARTKLALEVIAFALAGVWFVIDIVLGSQTPAAEFAVRVISRTAHSGTNRDRLVIGVTLKVVRGEIAFESAEASVNFLGGTIQTPAHAAVGAPPDPTPTIACPDLDTVKAGAIPAGDTKEISCLLEPGRDRCVNVAIELVGQRALPLHVRRWPRAHWRGSAISCPAAPVAEQSPTPIARTVLRAGETLP